jgi:hypothetical protein
MASCEASIVLHLIAVRSLRLRTNMQVVSDYLCTIINNFVATGSQRLPSYTSEVRDFGQRLFKCRNRNGPLRGRFPLLTN